MDKKPLIEEEKKEIERLAQRAVKEAWKNEQEQVKNGMQTRDWTDAERKELIEKGKVENYEGHHMQAKSTFPEQAGNPNNIQFLPVPKGENGKKDRSVHIAGHGGNFKNPTNGYYDEKTGKTLSFEKGKPPSIERFARPIHSKNEDIKPQETPNEGVIFMPKNANGGKKGGTKMGDALSGMGSSLGAVEDALGALGVDVNGIMSKRVFYTINHAINLYYILRCI